MTIKITERLKIDLYEVDSEYGKNYNTNTTKKLLWSGYSLSTEGEMPTSMFKGTAESIRKLKINQGRDLGGIILTIPYVFIVDDHLRRAGLHCVMDDMVYDIVYHQVKKLRRYIELIIIPTGLTDNNISYTTSYVKT